MKKRIAAVLIALAAGICECTAAADSLNIRKTESHVVTDAGLGYLFTSKGFSGYSSAADRKNLHTSASLRAGYAFSFTEATRAGRLYPGAYQGIGASVTTFFGPGEIGTPVSLYLFQGAPVKRFSRRLSMVYEWNFGASFGWKKFDYDTGMKANVIVGSRINALISLALMADYRLSRGLGLRFGLEGKHFSNGNTAVPNPGVNTLGLRLGLIYTPGDVRKESAEVIEKEKPEFRPAISYDLLLYGAVHKQLVDLSDGQRLAAPGRFGVAGISFAPMYGINRFLRTGISLDIKYDEAGNLQKYLEEGATADYIRFRRQPFIECLTGGLSARAELVMPVFSVNAGVGYNIAGAKANRKFYQILNLKTRVMRHLWINIGYQINDFHNPENLVIGLGYTFGRIE